MNEDRSTLVFARLAEVAAQRGQTAGRDRFLILAGVAATRAGWPQVAARCHQLVTSSAPRHLVARYPSFAEALRDADFGQFCRQLTRFCSPERGEHLLTELRLAQNLNDDEPVSSTHVLEILQQLE